MSALVVSVHDVSPMTREPVTYIVAALARIGVRRVSLLVVPDHHHHGNITADPNFGAWLRDLVAAGHEPVLHGYYHQRARHASESLRVRLFTRFYTADEGEFFDIPFREAHELLMRGRDELAQCAGAIPAGFIAPAWLFSAPGEAAAREIGFKYTTRLESVSNLAAGTRHHSQSLCWSVRSRWRRGLSLGWNPLLFQTLGSNALMRISIHPPDLVHPGIWRQVQHLAARALQTREATTYRDFVAGGGRLAA
jgi:predicted deacetylase